MARRPGSKPTPSSQSSAGLKAPVEAQDETSAVCVRIPRAARPWRSYRLASVLTLGERIVTIRGAQKKKSRDAVHNPALLDAALIEGRASCSAGLPRLPPAHPNR